MMELSLSVRLREGTKESHRLAEHSPFIRKFFEGSLSIEVYREFLLQMHYVYNALEDTQQLHSNHDVIGRIYFPSLFRSKALLHDLNYFYGNNSWEELQPHKATEIYVQRINTLSGEWIEGLIAHHYTRYLGDLSGGQVLKRTVAKAFKLPSNEGLVFYDFPQIDSHSQFKDKYRMLLDSMLVDETASQKIVDEANLAFTLNRDVFDSLIK